MSATTRWVVPGFALVLGAAMVAVGAGWSALVVMAVYAAVLVVGRRFDPIAVLGGDVEDERRRAIGDRATIVSAYVLVTVIVGMFLWELSQGDDGEPWSALGAVGGLSYIGASFVLSRRG